MAKVVITLEDYGGDIGVMLDIDPPTLFQTHPARMTAAETVASQALLFIQERNTIKPVPDEAQPSTTEAPQDTPVEVPTDS